MDEDLSPGYFLAIGTAKCIAFLQCKRCRSCISSSSLSLILESKDTFIKDYTVFILALSETEGFLKTNFKNFLTMKTVFVQYIAEIWSFSFL